MPYPPLDSFEALKKIEAENAAKQTADYYAHGNQWQVSTGDAEPHPDDPQYLSKQAERSIAKLKQRQTNDCAAAGVESLRTRVNRRASDASGELKKYSRAADILTRHPEFEEFLELLRLIPQHELYR